MGRVGNKTTPRSYRFSSFVYEELKKIVKELDTTETNFIEIAIIEKIARIQAKNEQDD